MGPSTILEKAKIVSKLKYGDTHLGTQYNNGYDFETTSKIIMLPYIPDPFSERS